MPTLVAILLLPLVIILVQIATGATGWMGNAAYKLAFIVPPVIYCRVHGIRLGRDIFRWQNWRNDLRLAVVVGVLVAVAFGLLYGSIGHLLIDKPTIAAKIHQQFSVSAGTVLLIAPFTILINSLVEEFFYRGFAFGLMAARRPLLGTLLPAAVFTVQHLLFAYHWVGWGTVALGVAALFLFSLITQALYAKGDSIVAPWIVHILGDLAMMTIAVELIGRSAG